jgi:hypothetical protein
MLQNVRANDSIKAGIGKRKRFDLSLFKLNRVWSGGGPLFDDEIGPGEH